LLTIKLIIFKAHAIVHDMNWRGCFTFFWYFHLGTVVAVNVW